MSFMYFHSLSLARVVSVGPVCDPQNQVGVIGLTGRIQKDKTRRVDTADTVCMQKYHVHSNVDGPRVLPADFLSPRRHHFVNPWSVRWQPIRFERMATVLIVKHRITASLRVPQLAVPPLTLTMSTRNPMFARMPPSFPGMPMSVRAL